MATYLVSGAGIPAADGVYEDRGIPVNGKPSYTNGDGWYLINAYAIVQDGNAWIIYDGIFEEPIWDFTSTIYYQSDLEQALPTDSIWVAGEPEEWAWVGNPPTVSLSVEPDPDPVEPEPDPFDPIPETDIEHFPEPELYPDELSTAELLPTVAEDFLSIPEVVWVITRSAPSGNSTIDVWRNGVPFMPKEHHDTRDMSEWRNGVPFIRWEEELPPQVSRNPALRKVRTFRHGPKLVVIGG